MNTEAAVLEARGLSKRFRVNQREVHALDAVDIRLRPGQVTGLIGPDGAGKTTFMRLACGLLRADAGELHVLGLDVARDAERIQATVGYMPQRFGLYEDLSVQENLDLYADLHGVTPAERGPRYAELMRLTGLGPFTHRLAGQLSGGMKQKLGLACVLVHPPPLLLLDEPTVGVDPVSRRELWRIIHTQVRNARMSVLLSTAYLDEAERCDEVIVLHQGRVLAQAPPAEFAASVAGRVWQVSSTRLSPRALQAELNRQLGVLDALVRNDAVRVVGADTTPPTLPADCALSPQAARFEDAFIARLKTRHAGDQAPGIDIDTRIADAADDAPVIEVERLERRFGDFVAVKGVSFSVRRGEVFGLLGANGAGKSTTFRMLCGLLPPSGGALAVAGHDLAHAAAQARARIGYMAQRFSLYAQLTVQQNLRFFAGAYGLRGKRRDARLQWAIETFELAPYRDTDAADLPLGYKQRLAFAAALMHEPEILFLDEPTSGVDPLARREFWARTNALAEAGVTVLVTTHFMEEADYCDRLVIMADGEVLAAGTPAEMKALARTAERPEPSMEDAFIALIEKHEEVA